MEKIEYLPLGSVVLLKGGIKKLVIVGRGLTVKMGEKIKFFDYAGAQFPEGIMGDQLGYFNHDGIASVVFKGYSDDDDKIIVAISGCTIFATILVDKIYQFNNISSHDFKYHKTFYFESNKTV